MESSLSPHNVRVHTVYRDFAMDEKSSEVGSTEDINLNKRVGHHEELNFNVMKSETKEYSNSAQIRDATKKASMQFVRNTARKKSRRKLKVKSQHEASERLLRHNGNKHSKLHL